ncbi:MAG: bifunctional phosphoribosylaminoimidazolecarboxamide formyltransferase/IMP cyclohydrolase [bacterium]|nr:bifunctional phosphoribosylaminoimidazolecarboxamide formyltransferase/IMP cyclohydrolase [bacterium]
MPTIRRALISVSDKTGIIELAQSLHKQKVEILSTGGTAKLLAEKGIPVIQVSDYTGFPEILDGRVKTLHPKVHAGILAIRKEKSHQEQLKKLNIPTIDLVVINLYPFEQALNKKLPFEEMIENIDIGGPTLLRAAAKNWEDVAVVVDPADYSLITSEVSSETRFRLAQKVFAHTAHYDGLIADYLASVKTKNQPGSETFPETLTLRMQKLQGLRYGENPHQKAAFYREVGALQEPSVSNAKQLQGKELSFNNILDLNAALEMVKEFEEAAVAIVKHNNPSGVAVSPSPAQGASSPQKGEELMEIFIKARECDPTSAFGGVIGLNRTVDKEIAEEMGQAFYEAVIAPGFTEEALKILKEKKNLRLLQTPSLQNYQSTGLDVKKVTGGFLVQDRDLARIHLKKEGKVVTKRAPTEEEWKGLSFAWKVVKHVKSNAIIFAHSDCTVGIGAGQMSRIDSTQIAISKARSPVKGTVLASDAFFPFKDNVEAAAKVGVTAIVQPGGSLRDAESIETADKANIAMVFTGLRHFKH